MSGEPTPRPEPFPAGARFYAGLCGAALFASALPLLARGLGLWSLFPALVGAAAVAGRWRSGPALFVFALLWLVVGDSMGRSPWSMIAAVLAAFESAVTGRRFFGTPRDFTLPRLQEARPLLDVLLAAAAVAYSAGQFRLVSLTRNVFPVDRRRRPRKPRPGVAGRLALGPPPEQRRSAALVDPEEAAPLLFVAVTCACLGQFLALWLSGRDAAGDLYHLAQLRVPVNISDGVWRLFVLVWVFAVVLIPVTGVLAYLGQRRMTPEEAGLYLQDQLWRQTRREQARLGRWLAWAEGRRRRREERVNRKQSPPGGAPKERP